MYKQMSLYQAVKATLCIDLLIIRIAFFERILYDDFMPKDFIVFIGQIIYDDIMYSVTYGSFP